jgi:hypothetical protein
LHPLAGMHASSNSSRALISSSSHSSSAAAALAALSGSSSTKHTASRRVTNALEQPQGSGLHGTLRGITKPSALSQAVLQERCRLLSGAWRCSTTLTGEDW